LFLSNNQTAGGRQLNQYLQKASNAFPSAGLATYRLPGGPEGVGEILDNAAAIVPTRANFRITPSLQAGFTAAHAALRELGLDANSKLATSLAAEKIGRVRGI